MIRIQEEDFDVSASYTRLRNAQPGQTGAVCLFTGLVRDFGDQSDVEAIVLEHYPGMTEKSLASIAERAQQRWNIQAYEIIHRVGALHVDDQIVLVGVSASHRADAFAACEFIMDYLKTEAPLWKKERHRDGEVWVEAKDSDAQRQQHWQKRGT